MKTIIALLILLLPLTGQAGSVTLAWDLVPQPDPSGYIIAGYELEYGATSRAYSTFLNTGNVTTFEVKDLAPGVYFFAVRAYSTDGLYSQSSNEVSANINGPPNPPTNLRILKVNAVALNVKATIQWTTNLASRGHVDYGRKEPLVNKANDGKVSKQHELTLKDLKRQQLYLFRITAATDKEKIVSDTQSFATK